MRDVTKLNVKQLNVCCNVPTLITLLHKGLGRHTGPGSIMGNIVYYVVNVEIDFLIANCNLTNTHVLAYL